MTIASILDMAAKAVAAYFEHAATFTPATGEPVSLRVQLEQGIRMQPSGYDAQAWASGKTIEYLFSDLGREAARGESFTVDGTVYTVRAVIENDGRFVKVSVS